MDNKMIEQKIKQVLVHALAVDSDEARVNEITHADPQTDMNDFEMNSIEFLEFIIEIEQIFDIDVEDEVLVNNVNLTLHDWIVYVSEMIASAE